MRIDASGNVGIGTTNPSKTLHVVANSGTVPSSSGLGLIALVQNNSATSSASGLGLLSGTAANGSIFFGDADDADVGNIFYSHSNNAMGFVTNASERMRIDSSGNVGIGTSSPASIVEIIGVNPKLTINANDVVNGRNATLSLISGTSADPSSTCQIMYGASNSTTAGTLTFVEGDGTTERMRIDSSGRVGIGTDNPQFQLHLSGSAPGVVMSETGAVKYYRNRAAASALTWDILNTDYSYNSEAMRIQSDGQVLIGTSSILSGGIDGLHLNTVGGDTGISFGYSGTTVGWLYYIVGAAMQLQTPNGTTIRMVSGTNGVELTNNATSWSSFSDERKKDIIEPITNAAEKVSTLRTVIGKYKEEDEGTRRAFLIAQDVQKVLPEAVGENDDGDLLLQYTETIPLLVAAIKEQQEQIAELKAEVAALKGA